LRATLRHQLSAVYNIEAGYLGAVDWDAESAVTGNNTLFSVFSDFGTDPVGGLVGVDQAILHRIRTNSHLDSVELNMRRTWASYNYHFHGSWLAGFRWLKLRDKFDFFADIEEHANEFPPGGTWPAAQTDVRVVTDNNLYGGQLGGQLGMNLCPGIIVNGEIKAGVYGVRADLDSSVTSTVLGNPLIYSGDEDDVALVAEANAQLTWQFHPMWKIRGGYQFLYIEGIALPGENLNNVPLGSNVVGINDNGNALLHGGALGVEFGW
jgi:hypothetical protein